MFDYVDDQGNNFGKPVVLVFGINVWKRKIVSDFLSEFSVKFVRKNTPWVKIKNEIKNIDVHAFVFWGMMEKRLVSTYAESKSIPIWRLEDGFLRSVGLGSEHVLPLSLALDKQGIYFNSAATSDLEEKISSIHWDESKQNRAQKNLEMILEFGLTKYNNKITEKNEFNISVPLLNSDKYKILVVGQVEDDASILHGSKIKHTNNDLVRIARAEFPDAEIYYRPHPDVAGGFRKEQSSPADVADICHVVTSNESIITWIDLVDHVFTITSLTGFEALMRGKKITVLGAPFYAGWGLSDDRQTVARRNTKRSLLEVFYASYIDYPKYHVGFLGNNAEVEHAILSLQLEKIGLKRLVAERIASSFRPSDINKENCLAIISKINLLKNEYGLKIPLFKNSSYYKEIFSSVDFLNKCEISIVDALLEGALESSLDEVTSFVLKSENKEVFKKILNIDPSLYIIKDYKYFVKILAYIFDLESAERLVNEKIKYIKNDFSEENLFKIFDLLKILYAEQGKLGRKPIDGSQLIEYFELHQQSIKNSKKYHLIVERYISHLSHYKMRDQVTEYVEFLLEELSQEIDFEKISKISTSIVRSLIATTKRADLHLNYKYILASKVFENFESKFNIFSISTESGNRLMQLSLAEISRLAGQDFDFKKYANLVYESLKDKKLEKNEIAAFKNLVSSDFSSRLPGGNYPEILKWLITLKPYLPEEYYLNLFGNCEIYSKNYHNAELIFRKLLFKYKKNQYRRKLAQIFENQGKISVALHWYREAINNVLERGGNNGNELEIVTQEEKRASFLYKSSEILNSVAQPKLPKGVVFVGSFGCLNTISMTVPVLLELKRNGYAVIQVDEGMLVNQKTGIEWIDCHAGAVPRVLHTDVNIHKQLQNEWFIDWQGKKIVSEGVNYYQGIFEGLTQKLRAFNFDINDPNVFKYFKSYLVRSDAALTICKSIRDKVMAKGMPVRFINCGSHSAPFAVYRAFCLKNSFKYDVSFVHMGPAYENYYSNLKSKVASTVSLENLTKYPYYRLPFLARPDLFEEWMTQDGLYEKYQEDINKFLNHNRVGKSENDNSTNKYVEKINLAKARGAKIICAYGKILCDMAVPFDGGPGHENIVDWLKHTVEVARNSDNFFILKPHPHELRPEIARDLNEYWLDNIDKDSLPENVLVLPHNGFNNQDLIPYLDLALLWNGTSSLELCAQGVPVVMASYFGKHDYPVDLIYPESRDDYENILNASTWAVPDRAKMERAALLLKYMGTEEVCIPFKYSYRPITNDPVGVPYWHDDEINGFLKNGDKFISKMADKFFN